MYITAGENERRAKLERAVRDERNEAQQAFEAWEQAKIDAANAKKKRGFWGGVIGAIAGLALAPFTGGSSLAWATGMGALGKQAGHAAYEQDWFKSWGGQHHEDMERAIEALDKFEEETKFADVRSEVDVVGEQAKRYEEEFSDISLERVVEEGLTDWATWYAAGHSLESGIGGETWTFDEINPALDWYGTN